MSVPDPGDSRSKLTYVVSVRCRAPWLIEGQPVLDAITVSLKAELGIVSEVGNALFLVEPTAISVPQSEREIPAAGSVLRAFSAGLSLASLVQGDERGDVVLKQLVDQVVIELEAFLVDWVITTTIGDESRPRDGEAVRVYPELGKDYRPVRPVQKGAETRRHCLYTDTLELLTSNVLLEVVQVCAGPVNMRPILDLAWCFAELVPDLWQRSA